MKISDLDTNDYKYDAIDTTLKRSTSFSTRISVFLVPPSENEAKVRLYTPAQKRMATMLECDQKVSILP